MKFPKQWIVAVVLSCGGTLMAQTTEPQAAPMSPPMSRDEAAANSALAERMAQLAQMSLLGKNIVPATLRQSAALLEAANRLNPSEPRFLRLLTEAYLQLGGDEGGDGAQSALTRYCQLVPTDLPAQIRLIDVNFDRMDSADLRKHYIDQLLSTDKVSAEVKSHVAVLAAKLSLQRGETDNAKSFVQQALDLFPLSPEALQFRYRELDASTPPAERVGVLLKMLESNPSQPAVMTQLASDLGAAGMVDPSLRWYQNAFTLTQRIGSAPSEGEMTAWISELVIADQMQAASSATNKLLDSDANNSDAALLSVLIARRGGDKDAISAATDKAVAALNNRLSMLSDKLNNRTPDPAATQPQNSANLADDVKVLQTQKDSDTAVFYSATLADLAWVQLYFNNKTADAQQYTDALRQLLPADSATLARLDGWAFLIDGKKDEAKVKLSAIADRDPLAQLGMIQLLDNKDKPEASKKLLASNASGLVGAMLIEALRSQVGMMPQGPDAAAIQKQLDDFPPDWMDFTDFDKVKNMYALKAEPVKVACTFGDPMLATLSITNLSHYNITLGPEGAIRPDMWIDVQVKGIGQQYIPGVAFERMWQKVVLKPKETVSQTVRVDQDGLAVMLTANPTIDMPLYFSVLTNPVTQQSGIAPGPGGYRVQFSRPIDREPSPISDAKSVQNMMNGVIDYRADVRIKSIDLLGTYSHLMRDHGDDAMKAKAVEFNDMVRKASGDAVPAVAAEATYVTVLLADANVGEGVIRQMLADSSFQRRILGVMAAQQRLDPDKRKELLKPLADNDADPLVKKLAAATIAVADLPAATQPATQPDASPAATVTP